MRIVLVGDYPAPTKQVNGGVEAVVSALAIGLKEYGNCDVHIVTFVKGCKSKSINSDGLTIHYIEQKSLVPDFIYYWTLGRFKIHKLLTKISPDVVHFQGLAAQSIGYDKPKVITIHGIPEVDVLLRPGNFRRIRSLVIKIMETIGRRGKGQYIAINPYVAEVTKLKPKTMTSISNPIEDVFFEQQSNAQNYKILVAGRVNFLKNTKEAIKIFSELVKLSPKLELCLVGALDDVNYVAECKQLCAELDIQDKVIFEGLKNREELCEAYKRTLFLLVVSRQEVAPMVISEAMASGVPVVSVDVGGVKNMFEPNIHGKIVEITNPHQVASEIFQDIILNNLKLNRDDIKEYAKSKYQLSSVVKKTLAVYEKSKSVRD